MREHLYTPPHPPSLVSSFPLFLKRSYILKRYQICSMIQRRPCLLPCPSHSLTSRASLNNLVFLFYIPLHCAVYLIEIVLKFSDNASARYWNESQSCQFQTSKKVRFAQPMESVMVFKNQSKLRLRLCLFVFMSCLYDSKIAERLFSFDFKIYFLLSYKALLVM